MRALVFLGIFSAIACGPVQAAETDLSEVDVIAIAPRSPDVKPFAIGVPADVRRTGAQSTVTRTETGKR